MRGQQIHRNGVSPLTRCCFNPRMLPNARLASKGAPRNVTFPGVEFPHSFTREALEERDNSRVPMKVLSNAPSNGDVER